MLKQSKVRLSAVKLAQLKQADQSWVLNQLPQEVSQKIKMELQTLSKFGLENPEFLIQQIEQENKQNSLSQESQTVIAHYEQLSMVERYLYFQCLGEERRSFMLMLSESNQSALKLFASRHGKILSDKFKQLFVSTLMNKLGGG